MSRPLTFAQVAASAQAQAPYMLAGPVPYKPAQVGDELLALPPMRSAIARRVAELAEALGLVAYPQIYSVALEARYGGGTEQATWQVVSDSNEGPFIVEDFTFPGGEFSTPSNFGFPRLMNVVCGARTLTDGTSVSYDDAIALPRARGLPQPAPIVIRRGDTLHITITKTDAVVVPTGTVLSVLGWVLRSRSEGSRVGDIADQVAATLLREGEWYAAAVWTNNAAAAAPASAAAQQNLNSNVIVERLAIVAPIGIQEAAVAASRVDAYLGNYQITPGRLAVQSTAGATFLLDDVRMPIAIGRALRVEADWPAGTRVPIRATIVGRRVVPL